MTKATVRVPNESAATTASGNSAKAINVAITSGLRPIRSASLAAGK